MLYSSHGLFYLKTEHHGAVYGNLILPTRKPASPQG